MAFIVDTARFQAEGAFLQWSVIAKRLGLPDSVVTTAAMQRPNVLQLRWTLKRELGLPTEPFTVWRRLNRDRQPKPINAAKSSLSILLGSQLFDLKGSYTMVELNVSGSGGLAYAFVGSPLVSSIVAFTGITAGNNLVVRLTAPCIEGLLVSAGVTVNSLVGTRTDDLTAASGWEKFEYVGLPVKKAEWMGQGIGAHGTEQGIFGSFTDAQTAARGRLERGAPNVLWGPLLAAGIPAPPWSFPAFVPFIDELNKTLLTDLKQIATSPPAMQAARKVKKTVPPPENAVGQKMTEPDRQAQVAPLSMTYMAAGTDCYSALGLGFGTAYPVVFSATGAAGISALAFDYMITARYEKGVSGEGPEEVYAAIVPAPAAALATPVPAGMTQEMMGHIRPRFADADWRASVRVSWEKPVPVPLFRPRSFVFARAGLAPASPSELLMNTRAAGGPIPIAVNYYTNSEDPEPNRVSAIEREIPIANNPGVRSLKYAVAHQDIFGQYSNWNSIDSVLQQPDVDQVRIVSAEFKFTAVPVPPAATCDAELLIEFVWDWRIRSPRTISFRGRLHGADYHGQPPPDITLPGGLQTALGGPFTNTFTLNFAILAANGAPTSGWPGYNPLVHCQSLNPAGDQAVAFGAAQGNEGRRYRVRIPGFKLNFSSKGHIGLALWAQAQEAIAPNRNGAWSNDPSRIAASDPRPPLIVPDIVSLGSLPDANGESHAILKWSSSPGADGYFIYETTETKLLKATGRPEPDPSLTLSQRLTTLLNLFDAAPLPRRSEFTRRNRTLLKTTSADVAMPRGSTSIHLYVVLGVSAGQVEAAWPTSSTALYAFAAPRAPKPGAPMIEVSPFLDNTATPPVYRARIRMETRKGPRVRRIDLHRVRVDDAAKELDTMGPPVLTVDALTAGWNVTQENDALGSHITVAAGAETPSGSWKRVWYRAAAWSEADLLRGTLPARSPASTVAWTVIPPSVPPNLSAITVEWPGTNPPDALCKWTSAAPLKKTPLGPHRISVRARRSGSPLDEPALIAFEGELDTLPAAPPAAGSGVWRVEGSKPIQFQAMVRRAALTDAVDITVRLTDPVGRTTERFSRVEPGPLLPDPDLTGFVLKNSLTPAGKQLNWSSTTPIALGYTLQVVVSRPPRQPFPNGPFIPQPAVQMQMLLEDVPLDEPGNVPAGSDPLRIRRMPGNGPKFNYYAFVRIPFTQILVRLTSPDGRSVQHAQPTN